MSAAIPLTRAARRSFRSAALLACAALALAAAGARAAQLGVPGSTGDPAGWLVLVSPDAVDPARSRAFGDIPHAMTFYIENPVRGLRVDLYDPGSFDPARGSRQLDENLDTTPPLTPAQVRYVLRDPFGAVAANQTFGPDTPATDFALVNLFNDNNAATGVWQLDVQLLDDTTIASEQDVVVFGLSVPGRQVFTYNLTGGEVNQGGATITEPVAAYPWLVAASAGADAFGPVCGAAFVSYDLDADIDPGTGDPVAPPVTRVTTRRGYTFPDSDFPPSGDARWAQTDNGGLPYDLLDSNDHGVWRWAFSDLTRPEDLFDFVSPPYDINAFSIQVLDYAVGPRDELNWPSVPPFGDGNPRRLYLPEDDGSAPRRPWLGHSARVTGGFPVIAQGETTDLEVTIELGNPHAFDLTNVVGESHVTPDPQVGDPVLVSASGGLVATITGRRIDFTGAIPAGTTATVVYAVSLTPTALGRELLTGDDVDFVSPGAPTMARYQAPYTPSLNFREEVLGPACQIEYESVIPGCTVVATLTAERTQACPGTPIRLDALASQVVNCPGGVPIHQWRVNGAVIHPFPAPDTIDVTPFLNDTWTLEVACSTDPACSDSDEVTFDLYPSLDVDAGADVAACPGDTTRLTALISNGTPPTSGYAWSTSPPGESGDGATTLVVDVSPTQTTTYTFTATDSLGCRGSDSVVVTVDVPQPAIDPALPQACPGEAVTLTATTGFASYAWTTNPVDPAVEGSTTGQVQAGRVGTTYTVTVTNAAGCTGAAAVTLEAAPPLAPGLSPPSPALCPGGTVQLDADAGYASYAWTTTPLDAAVEGATTASVTASQVGTTYTVTVTDARGCSGSAAVTTSASADPIPGPVGPSLRVTKSGNDTRLAWTDIPDPASGYEAVVLECADRAYRATCGAVPDPATMAASPATGPAVSPGTQALTHAGALDLGDLLFYAVRALSPCSATPGPTAP